MEKKRYVILDALRGFAILGICLANFPEFSLWTFSDPAGWTVTDKVTRAIQTFLVDGKFYTLFSLLFGMGFSIQLENAGQKTRTFYRRMIVLFLIGLCHLLFLWSGDILMLYAAMGMLLPLFKRLTTKGILISGGLFLTLPVLCEALIGTRLSDPLEAEQWRICALYGITEANFGTWLADITGYKGMLQFLHQGAVERMWEFVSSYRFFKVLGLFLIGYAAGREKMFADLEKFRKLLKNILLYGFLLGIPVGVLYTWNSMSGEPLGPVAQSVFYLLSVYPMGFAYAALFSLLFMRRPEGKGWLLLAKPGKVACTNYLMQSVLGVIIFYGIGFGLGGKVDLLGTEAIALGVYALEIVVSSLWINYFRYGPVEWVWRMMTYGKKLPLRRASNQEV
ncbi:MAG: DUF418 domain-containing protein [Bacteroidales bacterium]|nr:DUF418 domain-containing protein [Bacteroidales bacterium]